MVKLRGPLYSFFASGWLGRYSYGRRGFVRLPYPIAFFNPYLQTGLYYNKYGWCYQTRRTWHGLQPTAMRPPISEGTDTLERQTWRDQFNNAVQGWALLSGLEKGVWNSYNYPKYPSGYNRFIRDYLKRNYIMPGSIKMKTTVIGGLAIRLTNRTGAVTVEGDVLACDPDNDKSVVKNPLEGNHSIGAFLDSGVGDGQEAWVVILGIAEVRADAAGFNRGDWIYSSDATPGRVTGLLDPPGGGIPELDIHMQEIGHAIEKAESNETKKIIMHFD